MLWGTSYYPERTPEEDWGRDLDHMQAAGIRVLRLLDFAWSALEPREGEFTFGWLKRFLAMAHERGMQTIICTPTATPPAWLARQYPEIMLVNRGLEKRAWGNRREADIDSPIYRDFCAVLARKMGEALAGDPTVLGWQLDNELVGSELLLPECHTQASMWRFRKWLKQRHGDLDTVNQRWGMMFWNQQFADWGELETPHHARPCRGHWIDYQRYFSESQRDFLQVQVDALRAVIPADQWISHNCTAVWDRGLDHATYAEALDVVGWDAYSGAAAGRTGLYKPTFTALGCDWFRTQKGKPFWIFETEPFRNGSKDAHFAEMAARGAAGIVFWHWRSDRAHVEQGSNTMTDMAGRPFAEKVERLKRLAAELEEAGVPIDDPEAPLPGNETAIIHSLDSVRNDMTPNPYHKQITDTFLPCLGTAAHLLRRHGHRVDVRRPEDDFGNYRRLVVPSMHIMPRSVGEALTAWVRAGGELLCFGPMAFKDAWGAIYPEIGEPVRDLLGFTLRMQQGGKSESALSWQSGASTPAGLFMHPPESLASGDTEVLATFQDGPLAGRPAAWMRSVGKGRVAYSCACSQPAITELLKAVAAVWNWPFVDNPHDDVGILPDVDGTGGLLFNHGDTDADLAGVTVPANSWARTENLNS
ncbi:MAG: beta-galactosidase [Opitutales bacterium]